MRGLLLKDTYVISKLCRIYFLLDLVFIVVSWWADKNMFFIAYPCLISGLLPMTLISYDERERWDRYAGALPYTRAQLVSSKYLIGLCCTGIVLLLIGVSQACRMIRGGGFWPGEFLALMAALIAVSLIPPAILYPLVFKFGSEKGRILYYILVAVICSGSVSVMNVDVGLAVNLDEKWIYILLFGGAVLLYLASWRLAICFYKKREL